MNGETSPAGAWRMRQEWNGVPPYWFNATFNQDGSITLQSGTGKWAILGQGTISFYLTGTYGSAVYAGILSAVDMEGSTLSTKLTPGQWCAVRLASTDAAPPEELDFLGNKLG